MIASGIGPGRRQQSPLSRIDLQFVSFSGTRAHRCIEFLEVERRTVFDVECVEKLILLGSNRGKNNGHFHDHLGQGRRCCIGADSCSNFRNGNVARQGGLRRNQRPGDDRRRCIQDRDDVLVELSPTALP